MPKRFTGAQEEPVGVNEWAKSFSDLVAGVHYEISALLLIVLSIAGGAPWRFVAVDIAFSNNRHKPVAPAPPPHIRLFHRGWLKVWARAYRYLFHSDETKDEN